jgi:hypothetical protein
MADLYTYEGSSISLDGVTQQPMPEFGIFATSATENTVTFSTPTRFFEGNYTIKVTGTFKLKPMTYQTTFMTFHLTVYGCRKVIMKASKLSAKVYALS